MQTPLSIPSSTAPSNELLIFIRISIRIYSQYSHSQLERVVVTRRSTADAYRITQPALALRRPFLAPSSRDDDDDSDDDWDDDQAEDDDDDAEAEADGDGDGDRNGDDHAFCVNQSTGWEIDKLMLARVVVVAAAVRGASLHVSFHSLAISSLPISRRRGQQWNVGINGISDKPVQQLIEVSWR